MKTKDTLFNIVYAVVMFITAISVYVGTGTSDVVVVEAMTFLLLASLLAFPALILLNWLCTGIIKLYKIKFDD